MVIEVTHIVTEYSESGKAKNEMIYEKAFQEETEEEREAREHEEYVKSLTDPNYEKSQRDRIVEVIFTEQDFIRVERKGGLAKEEVAYYYPDLDLPYTKVILKSGDSIFIKESVDYLSKSLQD